MARADDWEQRRIKKLENDAARRRARLKTLIAETPVTEDVLMARVGIEDVLRQPGIGDGVLTILRQAGYTSALDFWDGGMAFVPALPLVGEKRQYLIEAWVNGVWQECCQKAVENRSKVEAAEHELSILPELLESRKVLIRQRAEERRAKARGSSSKPGAAGSSPDEGRP